MDNHIENVESSSSIFGVDPIYLISSILIIGASIYWWINRNKEQSNNTNINKPVINQKSPTVAKLKPKRTEGDGPSLTLFFGSQTGTAEEFSKKLAAEGKRYKFSTQVVDLEDYTLEDLEKETFAIFSVATYGEGEPTDNAREFNEWLMDESRPADLLKNLKYTVFGLGNKTYEKYNEIGRKFDKRLNELGGQRIFRLGEGDDDSSLEDDFAAWKKEMWPAVCAQFGIEMTDISEEVMNERKYKIINHGVGTVQPVTKFLTKRPNNTDTVYDAKNPYIAQVLVNRELHSETSGRSCRHIEISVPRQMNYEVGDHLGVYPENDQAVVEALAKRLGLNPDEMFSLIPLSRDSKMPKVGPCSVRQALTQYSDITTPPRKSVLRVLALHASNPEEKAKLTLLGDDSKAQPYGSFIKDELRTILEVLNAFPSVSIPFDLFLETVPRLAARYYSISSSLKEHKGTVHITAVVVNYVTPTGRKHSGVCSNYLTQLVPKGENYPSVPIYIHKSTFRVPKNPEIPVIMVGPGTGLAPFRGFIFERKSVHNSGKKTENILFFGCRSPNQDFIYREELEVFKDEGHVKLFVAFSRLGDQKVYVQHKIEENEEEIWHLLNEKKAHLYICGDARAMAKDVHTSLCKVLIKFGNKTQEQAEEYLNNLNKVGRYQTDVWF